ncbi:rCG56463 [Rattus norvegicus]|uniref:RCG56463 n=1 Tax=Rattus norvegicus TaxID=10116 RepID=A6IBN7_RAT|nr:rCG56463 [Rattus norvegicus]
MFWFDRYSVSAGRQVLLSMSLSSYLNECLRISFPSEILRW